MYVEVYVSHDYKYSTKIEKILKLIYDWHVNTRTINSQNEQITINGKSTVVVIVLAKGRIVL